MLDELKNQIAEEKRNLKDGDETYLTAYTCALSWVEGAIAQFEEKLKTHEKVETESWKFGYDQGYQRARFDYGLEDDDRYGNIDKIIRKLNSRIDEFLKKNPKKTGCEAVEMVREVVQMLDREADGEEKRRK